MSYAGVLCVFGKEATLQGANVPLGAALVFGSAVSYAVYLVYSGEEVKRLGALRLTGLATSVACIICIAQFLIMRPFSAMAVAPQVLWLSALNATACTFAPVLMVMMAIERIGASATAQTGAIGPLSTILMAVCAAGRAVHRLGGGRYRPRPCGDLAARLAAGFEDGAVAERSLHRPVPAGENPAHCTCLFKPKQTPSRNSKMRALLIGLALATALPPTIALGQPSLPTAKPENAGMSSERLARLARA